MVHLPIWLGLNSILKMRCSISKIEMRNFMFADLINENWTGGRDTYVALWEALREVYPEEIPAVGPGEIEFTDQPDLMIPYLSDQEITLEGPSWHGYWGYQHTDSP